MSAASMPVAFATGITACIVAVTPACAFATFPGTAPFAINCGGCSTEIMVVIGGLTGAVRVILIPEIPFS